jgi:hypothetical protein
MCVCVSMCTPVLNVNYRFHDTLYLVGNTQFSDGYIIMFSVLVQVATTMYALMPCCH